MMGYHFYNPYENKVFVACYVDLFENSITLQEASGSLTLQEAGGSDVGNSDSYTDKLIAKIDALSPRMDSQCKKIRGEMKEMPDSCNTCGGNHSTTYYKEDDEPMSDVEEAKFIGQKFTDGFVKTIFIGLKDYLETTTKNHPTTIQNIETKFNRFFDKQSSRPTRSLMCTTQPNPKHNSSGNKPNQPPQTQNEHVNSAYTKSSKTYDLPTNPNDSQKIVDFDSDDEADVSHRGDNGNHERNTTNTSCQAL
ncbi:hypothetical protein Tco_1492500 [Tanacetum coccineum]